MKSSPDYSLYLVTDRAILSGRDLCEVAEAAIAGGVTVVQLREKSVTNEEFLKIAFKLKQVTDKHNIPLIINDNLEVALAVDAAGLHLGQKDLNCKSARKLIGDNKILGISTATLEEALQAQKDGADYVGVGAVFPTGTKLDARDVTIDTLKTIKESLNIPVVAIGGINEKNASELKVTGIDGIAVVSAILGKKDVKAAAKELRKTMGN